MEKHIPSWDEWMNEAKQSPNAARIGMYLCHTGVVRADSRASVREGAVNDKPITGMDFSYDEDKLSSAVATAMEMPGIYYVKAWLNEGQLDVGEDIMHILVGGDIRPHVMGAMDSLINTIKTSCVTEVEK